MIKKTLAFFVLLLCIKNATAQDLVFKKSGAILNVKIVEVRESEVAYKKEENSDGPIHIFTKASLSKIQYQNGTIDSLLPPKIENISSNQIDNRQLNDSLSRLARKDAMEYYKAYRPAGTGTLFISLLSPIVGLVPAVIASSSIPLKKNLNPPNTELMSYGAYERAYQDQAHQIKKRRVWSNWGVGFGVNFLLVLFIATGQANR